LPKNKGRAFPVRRRDLERKSLTLSGLGQLTLRDEKKRAEYVPGAGAG
jgi:hypothetical protein